MSNLLNTLCINKIESNKIQLVQGVDSCDLKVDSCDFSFFFMCTMAILKPPNLKYKFFLKKSLPLPSLGN
jgi:hypothetical protein